MTKHFPHLYDRTLDGIWPDRDEELRYYCKHHVNARTISRYMGLNVEMIRERAYRLAIDGNGLSDYIVVPPYDQRHRSRRNDRDSTGRLFYDIPTLPPLPSLQVPLPVMTGDLA